MQQVCEPINQLYPRLILHGVQTFGSREVMRFLGRKIPVTPSKYGNFAAEVVSDLRTRAEGMRIKHRIHRNPLKIADSTGPPFTR